MTRFLFLAMLWCFFHKRIDFILKKWYIGTFLVVQWSRPQASNARGQGSVPGQETGSHVLKLRIPCATPGTQHSQINNFLKWYIENSSVQQFRCFPEVTEAGEAWALSAVGTSISVLYTYLPSCLQTLRRQGYFLFTSLSFFTFYFYYIHQQIQIQASNRHSTNSYQLSDWYLHFQFSSVTQSCLTLRHHELQHTRPPCPTPTPRAHPNSCPLSQWCHPTISSSVLPFSSHFQSFPTSGSFQMSQLFAWGGQNIGVSASSSVLPMNIQNWSPLGWTGWISLQPKGLSRVFSNTTLQKQQFFSTQFSLWSNSHIHTWPQEKP